jgi:hypothetical protein
MVLFGWLKNNSYKAFGIFIFVCIVSCNSNKTTDTENKKSSEIENKKTITPAFNADSAYLYVKMQVDFGPRVPGTKAHAKCADYLFSKLQSYGLEVIVQKATVQTFDKKQFVLKNIIASYKPELQKRIMLCSHWDTRPWADDDSKDKDKPFDSANDGASGVGAALEVARQISLVNPNIGIDIIYFDLEDYGQSGGESDTWCLGSQYWSKNLHRAGYYADFGILLDMVGAPNAIFPKEQNSLDFAKTAVDKVWKAADRIGYGNYFVNRTENFVGVDDHIYVNNAGIPCIDIIEYNTANRAFGNYHHTHNDNMNIIDKNTLKAVGQTLLEVIYSE